MNLDDSRSLPKQLFTMSWPIFLELILHMLVGNVDQIMLSKFNGTAVAAVSNANQIMNIVIITFSVICLASTILITQYKGAGSTERVNQIYTLSLVINAILSTLMMLLMFLFAGQIFTLMKIPSELFAEAKQYLLITAVSMPFQAILLTFSAFLRANAKMKDITIITAIMNILNIIGNMIMIGGYGKIPAMGAAGAAVSTTICRVLGCAICIYVFLKEVPDSKIHINQIRPFPKDLLSRILEIGVPSAGENLSYNFSQLLCLTFVNTMGTATLTAKVYVTIFAQIAYLLVSAISQASQVLVGYKIGARDYEGADRCTRLTIAFGMPFTVGFTIVLWAASGPILSLITTDATVIALCKQTLFIEIFLEIGRVLNIILVRNLQAVGDVKYPVRVGIFSMWVVAAGLGYLLSMSLGLGLIGLWLAFTADELLRGVIFVFRWRKGKWRTFTTGKI